MRETSLSPSTTREAYQHCQRLTKKAARNFYFAFITLPSARRDAIYAIYAFCRMCDDIADGNDLVTVKQVEIEKVRNCLSFVYSGGIPTDYIFLALADTIQRYSIPKHLFEELIAGVAMDLHIRRYATFDDLRNYCYRVASTVGLICLEVFGYAASAAQGSAISLGIGMQLTNIMRDLKEDQENDRIYLPTSEMEYFGYTEVDLSRGIMNNSFLDLMQFQASRARTFFEEGAALLPLLPLRSRACPTILHGLYHRLLDRIEEHGFDVFTKRIRLSTPEKVRLTAKLWTISLIPSLKTSRDPLS
jgi:phytoene synthase